MSALTLSCRDRTLSRRPVVSYGVFTPFDDLEQTRSYQIKRRPLPANAKTRQ